MSKGLMGVILLYLALTLTYLIAVPVGEAPDEPAHFLYAQHMADTGRPPDRPPAQRDSFWKNGFVTSNYQWHHPPLYYALGAALLRGGRLLSLVPRYEAFPEINPNFPGTMRPLFVAVPLRFTEVHLLRIFSALLGLGTVCATFALARHLLPGERWLPELSAGFVATLPQFNFLHAYVTNDALAILASSLALLALAGVALSDEASHRRHWLLAGSAVALALATKLTTWYLLPLAFFLAILQMAARRRSLINWLVDLFIFFVVAGSGLLISWLLWPDLFHRLLSSPQSQGINPDHLSLAHLRALFPMAHTSFWGMFGWVNMPLPSPLLWVLDAILFVGLASAPLWLQSQRQRVTAGQWSALALLALSIGAVLVAFWYFNLIVGQPQGRFLFTALPAIGLGVALGWLGWAKGARGPVALGILALMLAVNVTGLITVVFPNFGLFSV